MMIHKNSWVQLSGSLLSLLLVVPCPHCYWLLHAITTIGGSLLSLLLVISCHHCYWLLHAITAIDRSRRFQTSAPITVTKATRWSFRYKCSNNNNNHHYIGPHICIRNMRDVDR